MFKEILQIIPMVSDSDLNSTFNKMSQKFNTIAKKFSGALKVGMLAAVGGAVVAKLLAPIEEVKAAIDRTLKTADDVVTAARQFGTSPEKLLKLQAIGKLTGVESEQMQMLLTKFQTALISAKANPSDPNAPVFRNFNKDADVTENFIAFIRGLQKQSKNESLRIQESVFGEKQINKMAEFLQTDFPEAFDKLGRVDFKSIGDAAEKLEKLEGKQRENRTINELRDLQTKGGLIGDKTIAQMNESEKQALARENDRIARFQQLSNMNLKVDQMADSVEKLLSTVVTQVPIITTALDSMVTGLQMAAKGWEKIPAFINETLQFFKDVPNLFKYWLRK